MVCIQALHTKTIKDNRKSYALNFLSATKYIAVVANPLYCYYIKVILFFDILDKRDVTSLFSRPNLDNRFLVSTSYAQICDIMNFDKYDGV